MITIITGTPGAGKTLYTIDKLLRPLVGEQIPIEGEDGVVTLHPRTIYSNINGLLIDHELIDGGDNLGLRDWHKWAKPGSVIVFDEYQRVWPPRANGSKVPDEISALDTHRHMGVDFILITQNVINTDRHIHALAGRHLHIRRIANMPMAIVYEWDHVSRGLLYAKSLTKTPWRYSKKVFELYKSAEVHTKQPRKLPGVVFFILAAVLALSILAPTTYARLTDRISGGQASTNAPQAKTPASGIGARPAAPGQAPADTPPAAPAAPAPAPASSAPEPVKFAGCIQSKARCQCFNNDGSTPESYPGQCTDYTTPKAVVLAGGTFPEHRPIPAAPPPSLHLVPLERGPGLEDLRRALRSSPH